MRRPTLLLFTLITVLYALMFFVTPYQLDDFVFLDYAAKSDSLATYLSALYNTENWRLANIILPLVIDGLSKWSVALLFGASFAGSVTISAYLLSKYVRKLPIEVYMALIWAFWALLLPWRAHLFVWAYTINYVPGMCLALVVLLNMVKDSDDNGIVKVAGGFMIGFLAGWWAEATAIPVAAAGAVFILAGRLRVHSRTWAILGGLVLGMLWVVTSPAALGRLNSTTTSNVMSVKAVLTYAPALIILAGLIVFCAFKDREVLKQRFVLTLIGGAASILVLIPAIGLAERAQWMSEALAVLAVVAIAVTVVRNMKMFKICAWTGAVAAAVLISLSIAEQRHIAVTYDEVKTKVRESATGTVFYDLPPKYSRPLLLNYPNDDAWYSMTQIINLSSLLHKPVNVVPEQLADFSPHKAELIDGENGIYEYCGYLVASDRQLYYTDMMGCRNEANISDTRLTINGKEQWVVMQRFTASDGQTYIYLSPVTPRPRKYRLL